jgi:hypothetical protein
VLAKHATLRRHKLKVAFFDEACKLKNVFDVVLQPQELTKVVINGPFSAVLPNYGDEAFIKVLLDERSLHLFQEHLENLPDSLSRALVWLSLHDMAQDGKLSSEEYLDVFVRKARFEASPDLLTTQLTYVLESIYHHTPYKFLSVLRARLLDFLIPFSQEMA